MNKVLSDPYGYDRRYHAWEDRRDNRADERHVRSDKTQGLQHILSVHNPVTQTAEHKNEAKHRGMAIGYGAALAQGGVTNYIKHIKSIEYCIYDTEHHMLKTQLELDDLFMEIRELNILFPYNINSLDKNTNVENRLFECNYDRFNRKNFHMWIKLAHLYNDFIKTKMQLNFYDYQIRMAYENKRYAETAEATFHGNQ